MANFCGKCGTKLDPQTNLCPKCVADKTSHDSENKDVSWYPGRFIKLFLIVIAVFIIILSAAYGLSRRNVIRLPSFLCLHEWQNATCISAKTCRLCGKTCGEALDHDWKPATCTIMQTCRVCGATKGVPLGHTIETEVENNILHAQRHIKETCLTCGAVLKDAEQPLDSFIEDDLFVFSPQEFIDRVEYYAKQSYPNFRYTYDSINIESVGDALFVRMYLDESSSVVYGLSFLGADGTYLTQKDLDNAKILGVTLEKVCEIDPKTGDGLYPIDGNVAKVFYLACDPVVSEDDLLMQQAMHLCTFANWMDYNEPVGYSEINGVSYVFSYAMSKNGEQFFDMEAIQARAFS